MGRKRAKPGVRIKVIEEDDLRMLLPLIRLYWDFEDISNFDPDRIEEQLKVFLARPQLGLGWLARSDDENPVAVGYMLAVYVFSLEHLGLTAEIDEFFILPEYRAKGIGSLMVETAEKEFQKAGCTNVSLQVDVDNSSAHEFYQNRGYGRRPRFVLLEKDLG